MLLQRVCKAMHRPAIPADISLSAPEPVINALTVETAWAAANTCKILWTVLLNPEPHISIWGSMLYLRLKAEGVKLKPSGQPLTVNHQPPTVNRQRQPPIFPSSRNG